MDKYNDKETIEKAPEELGIPTARGEEKEKIDKDQGRIKTFSLKETSLPTTFAIENSSKKEQIVKEDAEMAEDTRSLFEKPLQNETQEEKEEEKKEKGN